MTGSRSHRSGLTEVRRPGRRTRRSGSPQGNSPHNTRSTQLHSSDWNATMRTHKKVRTRLVALGATAAAAFFLGAVPAYADNGPHVSTATNTATTGVKITDAGQGRCASCHRAHTARAAYLLNATSEESLCYSCHGDGGTGATTDVQSGLGYDAASRTTYPDGKTTLTVNRGTGVAGTLRGGGFEKAALGTGSATKEIYFNAARASYSSRNQLVPPLDTPETTTSNHLGGVGIMWGNGAISGTANAGKDMSTTTATKLECTACHDPHGNGQYRILRAVPVRLGLHGDPAWLTPRPASSSRTRPNKVYTTANYWIAGDPNAVADTGTTTILGEPPPRIRPRCRRRSRRASARSRRTSPRGAPPATRATSPRAGRTRRTRETPSSRTGTPATTSAATPRRTATASSATWHTGRTRKMPNSKVEWPNGTTPSSDSRLLRVDDRGTCVMCHNV